MNSSSTQPVVSASPGALSALLLQWLPLFGVLLLLVATPYHVMGRNLWGDEAFTASYTAHPNVLAVLEDVRKNEETPPLYFLSMWLWVRVVGDGEIALRSFSLLCGVLTICAFAIWVRSHLSAQAALVAVTTFALAPLYRIYLVEARAYALSVLLVVLCLWAFERLRSDPERLSKRLVYAATAVACFLTSYITVALLMAHWLVWLVDLRHPVNRRRRVLVWVQLWLGVGLVVALWLPALFYQVTIAPEVTTQSSVGFLNLYVRLLSVLMGHPLPDPWQSLWLLVASLGYMLIVIGLARPRLGGGLHVRTVLSVLPMTILVMLILGIVWAKYALMVVPVLALGLGVGSEALAERMPRISLGVVALIVGTMVLYGFVWYPYPVHQGWRQATGVIAATAEPGDMVVMGWPADQRVFEYYYRGPALPIAGAKNFDDFYVGMGYSYSETWHLDEVMAVTAEARRVWVVEETFYARFRPQLPYRLLESWDFGWIKLRLYQAQEP